MDLCHNASTENKRQKGYSEVHVCFWKGDVTCHGGTVAKDLSRMGAFGNLRGANSILLT